MNVNICPCCGQDIVIPNELTSINVRWRPRLVLFKLYRNAGKPVRWTELGLSRAGARVYISRLREAIRDAGLPWRIVTLTGEGKWILVLVGKHVQREPAEGCPSSGKGSKDCGAAAA